MRKETKKIVPVLLLSLLSCVGHFALMAQAPAAYVKEIETWHAKRINELKAPDGWLNLAGLYWLQEGRNDFGSGVENTIVFPMGTVAASAGYFQRAGDKV